MAFCFNVIHYACQFILVLVIIGLAYNRQFSVELGLFTYVSLGPWQLSRVLGRESMVSRYGVDSSLSSMTRPAHAERSELTVAGMCGWT